MKEAKFNPTGQPGAHISYAVEKVGTMSRKDFGESSEAQMLFAGQKLDDATRNTYLDAWHADAQRIVAEEAQKQKPAVTESEGAGSKKK